MKWLKDLWQTYVFDPLAGGNGKIQMAEVAQLILLVMIINSSLKEGKSAEQLYPDIYWTMIFTAVCFIAGYKIFIKPKDPHGPIP